MTSRQDKLLLRRMRHRLELRMHQITLIRHGESAWNAENRFTGWADIDITPRGLAQIGFAAHNLLATGTRFDIAFTSELKRCIRSQWTLLDAMDCMWLPQHYDWRLNERHYGALTGMTVASAIAQYGEQRVRQWRRAFDCAPPALQPGALLAHLPVQLHNDLLSGSARCNPVQFARMPLTESLKETIDRISVVWRTLVADALACQQRVLMVGHGNTIRGFIKLIEDIADDEVVALEVPNATPIVYDLDNNLKVIAKRVLYGPPQAASGVL
jgi:2,3-bisphosphoglycerate-dependent phosphoglycerate mutase